MRGGGGGCCPGSGGGDGAKLAVRFPRVFICAFFLCQPPPAGASPTCHVSVREPVVLEVCGGIRKIEALGGWGPLSSLRCGIGQRVAIGVNVAAASPLWLSC